MRLSPGDKLGPYEIVAAIGAGGMGVVYRAHDARVGRDVAIKVSAERFTDRFDREARAVAALNHANICTLYDVGPNYLVMEMVEGEPLRGPLPLQTALHYARQIADALDAAHEKGIVHRDLKPDNIRIRSDGTVKMLDFGLAKVNAESPPVDPANSPTIPVEGTHVGTILGTAAYMAPEQARGRPVDKRADIWAFGVVFYEMLTGRRAFAGDDVSTIIGAVIHSEPRWDDVPSSVRRLLESCLQKDPRKRLRDIGDVWTLLDDRPATVASPSRSVAGWSAAALFAAIATVALWAPWRSDAPESPRPMIRLDLDVGPEFSLAPLRAPTFSSVIVSPDATRIVFVGNPPGRPPGLWTRRLDQSEITELPGTHGASNPFFSPDGSWVAFWDGRRLAKVPVAGGAILPLADSPTMAGGSWSDDGNLIIGAGGPAAVGLLSIPGIAGTPTPVAKLASGELFHTSPYVLPGGQAAIVAAVRSPPSLHTTNIDVITFADGQRKTLVRGAVGARYVSSGHLLYAIESTLYAVPFDLERLEPRGTAVAMLDDLALDDIARCPQYDTSREGTLVYRRNPGRFSTTATVQWVDATGQSQPLIDAPGHYVGKLRLSPDGTRVAFVRRDGPNDDVWVYDVTRESATRLTFGGGTFVNPVWSHDGRFVIIGSLGDGLFWTTADGGRQPQPLLPGKTLPIPMSLSPDGRYLAYMQPDSLPQIWTVELHEDGAALRASAPKQFMSTPFTDDAPAFAPDGRWLAYESNESGTTEVYVRPFTPTAQSAGAKVNISNGGGMSPAWLPKTRQLSYRSGSQIMVVDYSIRGETFVAGKPRVWRTIPADATTFDLAPDGKRLAVVVPRGTSQVPRPEGIVVVQNFFDELRRRVPR